MLYNVKTLGRHHYIAGGEEALTNSTHNYGRTPINEAHNNNDEVAIHMLKQLQLITND